MPTPCLLPLLAWSLLFAQHGFEDGFEDGFEPPTWTDEPKGEPDDAAASGRAGTSGWGRWLPLFTVAGMSQVTPLGRELRILAAAEVPLQGEPTRRLTVTAPPSPPDPLPHVEAPCLPTTRTHAVTRAAADPARARSLLRRAGRSAWLPSLSVRVSRRLGRREALDVPRTATSAPAPLGVDTADDVRYEARASWDLGRIIFNPEELAAQAQALRMADMRREIETLVNKLYFERRRLTLEATAPEDGDPPVGLRRQVRVEELTAELEALSDGAFGRCLATLSPSPDGSRSTVRP